MLAILRIFENGKYESSSVGKKLKFLKIFFIVFVLLLFFGFAEEQFLSFQSSRNVETESSPGIDFLDIVILCTNFVVLH
jgi:hypothetical protein